MGHRLVLELPQEVYEPLADSARRAGSTPEGLAVAWLAAVGRHAARDPVEPFIGAFRSDVPDWAEQHGKYLGQALAAPLSGADDAIAEKQQRLASRPPTADWVERFTGSFKDKPAFAEVVAYGRALREADRPREDDGP